MRLRPWRHLSSGQLEIFTFFAAIIEAKDNPQLVVMDEPELHAMAMIHFEGMHYRKDIGHQAVQ